jgi:hypothetical protein
MAYIGNTVNNQGFTPAIDYFNGDGTTVTFTLSRPIASVAQVIVAVDNVIQNPSSAFNVVGNSITFTSAPLSGTNNIWVEYTSLITTFQGISQDPTVIGDIRATGGYLAEGDFGNSFIDGAILDYVTGAGRVTVGELDDLVFYHGGTAGRSEMMRMSYAGNSYIVGNLGVGETTPGSYRLNIKTGSFPGIFLNGTGTGGSWMAWANSGTVIGYIGSAYHLATSGSASDYSVRSEANLVFCTNGANERMRINSSGNVGIGTTSPSARLDVLGTAGSLSDYGNGTVINIDGGSITTADTGIGIGFTRTGSQLAYIKAARENTNNEAAYLGFATQNSAGSHPERMRITSGGELLVNSATGNTLDGGRVQIFQTNDNGLVVRTTSTNYVYVMQTGQGSNTGNGMLIRYGNSVVGSIQTNGSSTSYVTSSDYRLKENIAPMTGALATVAQLKPCTYNWKVDGSDGQGFIAHELAEVCPDAVTGEKDAVDADGNIKPQGIDTSFLVATLTAAIQEQQAMIEELKTKVAALEAK